MTEMCRLQLVFTHSEIRTQDNPIVVHSFATHCSARNFSAPNQSATSFLLDAFQIVRHL